MNILRLITILLLCCLNITAQAGARGRVMAFIDISTPPFIDGKDNVIALRRLINVDGKSPCWACAPQNRNYQGISILYAKKLPAGITYQAVKSTVNNDLVAKKTLQKAMATFKDKQDGAMLDGLYAYEHSAKMLNIYIISPVANEKIGKLSLAINDGISLRDLDDYLEKAARKIVFYP